MNPDKTMPWGLLSRSHWLKGLNSPQQLRLCFPGEPRIPWLLCSSFNALSNASSSWWPPLISSTRSKCSFSWGHSGILLLVSLLWMHTCMLVGAYTCMCTCMMCIPARLWACMPICVHVWGCGWSSMSVLNPSLEGVVHESAASISMMQARDADSQATSDLQS